MPSISRRITAIGITAAIAGSALAVPAASMAKATGPGKYTVTAASTYTFHKAPATGFDGTLFKGDTFKVSRISKSGDWAYGYAYGHVNRKAWVKASALNVKK
jgi:hypothetical protein